MAAHAAITIKNYYRSFGSISGALAGIFGLGPLLSLAPVDWFQYGFPPLGDVTIIAHVGLLALVTALTYVAFYFPLSRLKLAMSLLVAVAVLALCFYLVDYMKFVRRIPIPSTSSTVQVSVGYERTAFANRTFGDESDWDLLRDRSFDDEQISRLWTTRSIYTARLLLFASFAGFILPLVLAFSLGVRAQMK